MVRTLWRSRALVWSLTRRQFHLRYRQSALGFLWAVVVPVATLGVGGVVFKNIADVDTKGTGYGLFALAGIVPWTFFASSLSFGIGSIVQEKNMVIKLAFPRAALPLSMIGVSLLDFAIAAAIFVGLSHLLADGVPLTALWFPLLLAIEICLVTGIVLLGSSVNVFARDVRLGIPMLVQFWLLLTPVLYPLPTDLRSWYALNPMTGIVSSFRRTLTLGQAPDMVTLVPSAAGALLLLVVGLWYFRATEPRFADAI
jgi:lipopolysaccharide transport system permease protein